LSVDELPSGVTIRMDGGVLAFSAACAILTGLAFGLVPVFHVIRRDLNEVFRQGGRTGTTGRGALWMRSALVVVQVALAFVLLAGSGLLLASFARLLTVNPGFQARNVMAARFSLPEVRYKDDAGRRAFVTSLLEGVRAIPGVAHAGATTYLPFSGSLNASLLFIEGYTLAPGELPPVPGWNTVDSGYLQAMGIPILRGRGIEAGDGPDAPKVAVIDEFMARKYWPKGNPIGARLRRGGDKEDPVCTIVGIAGSVKTGDLAEQNPVGHVYFSYQQFVPRDMHVVVQAARDDARLTAAIRRALEKADPELALFDVKSMPQRVAASVGHRRAVMVVCLAFAALALLLAAVGVYGVLAYAVTQRTREFGIRSALGAGIRDVLMLVVGQGVRLAALGLAIGVAGALALTQLMTTLLFGVKPGDPILYLEAASVLMAVALVAALIPSVRAARIQPATALRVE
jgi:predicted permease